MAYPWRIGFCAYEVDLPHILLNSAEDNSGHCNYGPYIGEE